MARPGAAHVRDSRSRGAELPVISDTCGYPPHAARRPGGGGVPCDGGRVARNAALARPYQVHTATAPTAAARPKSLTPGGAATVECAPANSAALVSASPARLRATGAASSRQGSAGVRQLLATATTTGMDPMIVSVTGAPIFWM